MRRALKLIGVGIVSLGLAASVFSLCCNAAHETAGREDHSGWHSAVNFEICEHA